MTSKAVAYKVTDPDNHITYVCNRGWARIVYWPIGICAEGVARWSVVTVHRTKREAERDAAYDRNYLGRVVVVRKVTAEPAIS